MRLDQPGGGDEVATVLTDHAEGGNHNCERNGGVGCGVNGTRASASALTC